MAATATRASKRTGERYCCVVDCHNSKGNTRDREPPVKFYRFPGKWYEKERRKAWIAAVRRVNPDGTKWVPTTATRICSDHFVGNCRNEIIFHPAYVPTIFPPAYRKKASHQARGRGMKTRSKGTALASAGSGIQESHIGDSAELLGDNGPTELPKSRRNLRKRRRVVGHVDKASQTGCISSGELVVFLSATNRAEAITQVLHADQNNEVAMTNEAWESTCTFQESDYLQETQNAEDIWSHVLYVRPFNKTAASFGAQEQ